MHTAGVVAGSQEDAASGLALPDNMTGGRGGEEAVFSDDELLHAVGSSDLGDQLNDLGVPVPAIAANDEERACM